MQTSGVLAGDRSGLVWSGLFGRRFTSPLNFLL